MNLRHFHKKGRVNISFPISIGMGLLIYQRIDNASRRWRLNIEKKAFKT